MLLGALSLLPGNPLAFFIILFATGLSLLIAITVHEFSHALTAYRLGDDTAKRMGRLSLNPLAHLDPMGTILLLLVGFGWGKPVPVDHRVFGNGRRDIAMVAVAGPISNIATAAVASLPLRAGLIAWPNQQSIQPILGIDLQGFMVLLLSSIIFYNVILAVFNLIPLSPLDGSKVALGVLPREISRSFARLEMYGPAILLLIIALDYFTGVGILWKVIGPMVNYLTSLFLGRSFL